MNVSYKWLEDLIEISMPPEELAERLTSVGLELDALHKVDGDHIFDIETTSNRGDCLSHLGVAREISAFTGEELVRAPVIDPETGSDGFVSIGDPDLCLRFTGRIIRGVKIGPSPAWLRNRLERIGERPINNVADITNYVMHELGQPMHAFDLAKLEGERIIVRRARENERITTLDEVERVLDPTMLMICDAEKPAAVGGVMGGFDSAIGADTSDVLLEVACFDRDSIRRTSRKLGLVTEASYRFERGVDIENLIAASQRATAMIEEFAGGQSGEFADVYPETIPSRSIEAPQLAGEVRRLSGLDVNLKEIERILSALGIDRKAPAVFVSPSWRHDLAIEEDLVEEVVRIVGYDKIGERLPEASSTGEYLPAENRKRDLRRALATIGFNEALTYSFISSEFDEVFGVLRESAEAGSGSDLVEIVDPIIEGASRMRPTLVPGLLDSIRTNLNQRIRDIGLFEIGKVFFASDNEEGLPLEREHLAIALTGRQRFEGNETAGRIIDFYDIKGAIELAFEELALEAPEFDPARAEHLQPGQSAKILHRGRFIGTAGRLAASISKRYKFKDPVYVAELLLEDLLNSAEDTAMYIPPPVYPSVERDVSMAVPRDVSFESVRTEIIAMGFELCRSVGFVDVFEGKGLADDERSVTIRLEYRSDERTLTEEEVDPIHGEILENLRTKMGLRIR